MAGLHLEIVTPTRLAFSDPVSEVSLPGRLGELGVMPGHLPLLTTLQAGHVAAHTNHGVRSFAVGGGFAQILPDRVRILVEECAGVDEIDLERAREELAAFEKRRQSNDFVSTEELDEATEVAARARARIALVERATKG